MTLARHPILIGKYHMILHIGQKIGARRPILIGKKHMILARHPIPIGKKHMILQIGPPNDPNRAPGRSGRPPRVLQPLFPQKSGNIFAIVFRKVGVCFCRRRFWAPEGLIIFFLGGHWPPKGAQN